MGEVINDFVDIVTQQTPVKRGDTIYIVYVAPYRSRPPLYFDAEDAFYVRSRFHVFQTSLEVDNIFLSLC